MLCPSCGAENPPSSSFCGHCGASLPRLCRRCGFENPSDFSFCSRCGTDLSVAWPGSTPTPQESERRFAVILFADIAGFTRMSEHLDPEEATELVNRFLDEMATAVLQYGGRVDKYMGDGLMAVFGPPTAHDDDPERALRAAIAMRERTAGLWPGPEIPPIALHIGLACGPVVVAGVGSKEHREQTLIGTSVSLAARLEEASVPGQILVSEEMARRTEHAFLFQPVALSGLTGWEGAVRAFELLGEHPEAGQPLDAGELHSPLVGREAEIALLWRSLQNLTVGKGAIISIIGDTGVGKSRLVAEIRTRAQREGLLLGWLEGYPLEDEPTTPWTSFRTLLRNAIGVTPHTAPSETRSRLLGFLKDLMLERHVDEFYPYLGWLLDLPLEPAQAERVKRTEEEELGWRLFQIFQHSLAALAARKPAVLVFEDLDRADLPSVKLLERILPLTAQTPLAICSLYCPEPERPSWRLREIAGKRYGNIYSELWLHPLPPVAAREMVVHLLGADRSLGKAVNLILQRAEGNPLFIKEIIRSMAAQGILVQRADGKWAITKDPKAIAVPDTVREIFRARIVQLDEETQQVLRLATRLGRRFSVRPLAEIAADAGISPSLLSRSLEALQRAGLIQPEDGSPEGEYAFKHGLIRDVVHATLTTDRELSQEALPPLGDGPASPGRSDVEAEGHSMGRGNRRPSG